VQYRIKNKTSPDIVSNVFWYDGRDIQIACNRLLLLFFYIIIIIIITDKLTLVTLNK